MKVYRYEDAKGYGPYLSNTKRSKEYQDMVDRHNNSNDHPICGPKHIRWGDHRYGFESIDQLEKWFNSSDRSILTKHKFTIRVYEVEICEICKNQVIFDINCVIGVSNYEG